MNTPKELHPKIITPTKQLSRAEKAFDKWRRNRNKRERIPDHLWDEAVRLCEIYSINQVVQALHLNYQAFKKRVMDAKGSINYRSRHSRKEGSVKFIDLMEPGQNIPSISSNSNSINIEIQKLDGTIMKISVPWRSGLDIKEILSAFSMKGGI